MNHPPQPLADRMQSTSVVPETPLQTESTGTRSLDEGGMGISQNSPEPPPLRPLPRYTPPRTPLSPQFMPPPPNPPQLDEDETMDVVPDSEPSRMADGSMSSLHLPVNRAPALAEEDEIVPESTYETDDRASAQMDVGQGGKQRTGLETELDDDPMDDDQPLVKQRTKRPQKPVVEEEEHQAEQEVRDDVTVPETEDEVPLAIAVKPSKPAPKPLPPRGRSTRNKRPIIYTESPDTSENEVRTVVLLPTYVILKHVSGTRRRTR